MPERTWISSNPLNKPALTFIYLIGALCLAAALHFKAGLSLPLPVGDEVAFYYPAEALARQFTLKTNHLLPSRPLFWMPPGFIVLLSGWLRVFGEGLVSARWYAFALGLGSFCSLLYLVRVAGLGILGQIGSLLAYLSRHWVVMGNMVRMEGLFLTLILAALALLWQRRLAGASALLFAALLVHPNALYVLAAFPLLIWQAGGWRAIRKPALWEILALGGSLLLCFLYGVYCLYNWDAFIHDWAVQFLGRPKGFSGILLLTWRADVGAYLLGWGILYLWARRISWKEGLYLLCVALLLWAIRVVGQGWCYGIYNIIAVVLTAVVAIQLLFHKIKPIWARGIISIAILIALYIGRILNLPTASGMEWQYMHPSAQPSITTADGAELSQRLAQALPPGLTKLYTVPEGEGILLPTPPNTRWRHVLPVFGQNLPTAFLLHYGPAQRFMDATRQEIADSLAPNGLPKPIYSRGTDHWYLLFVKGGKLPAFINREDPVK